MSLPPLQGPQTWQTPPPPNMGSIQQRGILVNNYTSWRAPPPCFPSSLLTKQRTVKSGGRSAPPLSSNISRLSERWRKHRILENLQHTPVEDCLFQFRPCFLKNSEAKKSSRSLFSLSIQPPESGAPLKAWFPSALWISIVLSCDLQRKQRRVWLGAGGQQQKNETDCP